VAISGRHLPLHILQRATRRHVGVMRSREGREAPLHRHRHRQGYREPDMSKKFLPADRVPPWRVGVFVSSSEPHKHAVMVAVGDEEIAEYGAHRDFVMWLTEPARPEGQAPAAPPSIPREHVEGFLCYAWGETDLPEARLVRTEDEWRAFVVEAQWGPVALFDLDDEDQEAVAAQVAYIAHDMGDNNEGEIRFEIGGVSVERVTFDAAPPSGVQAATTSDHSYLLADLRYRARYLRQPEIATFRISDLAEDLAGELDRAIAALSAAPPVAPAPAREGWRWVPKEPTEAMSLAGRKACAEVADKMEEAKLLATSSIDFWQRVGHNPERAIWDAMLSAAAPAEPPAVEGLKHD
jgi:hypothetical protein